MYGGQVLLFGFGHVTSLPVKASVSSTRYLGIQKTRPDPHKSPATGAAGGLLEVCDSSEVRRLQAGPAHERAVYVLHGHELGGIVRFTLPPYRMRREEAASTL